ncbi:MAG TPA: glycerol-3-phosphate dehydrogenase/oxidase [Thermoanaerobaculia bacterium]|nr:glycerol-3-phosphate dehydrogenase/oxidase [Thermoanaerobaculia bacterium]
MNRERSRARLAGPGATPRPWDVLVIGGGATGLGAAVEAAARGYRTALLEGSDFAKGTSSRSTKLAHGGVRYLRQGDLSLVIESLRERGLLLRNAPHLVRHLRFVVPSYEWWEGPFYGAGLKVYDLLAGRSGLGPSHQLSREETLALLPTVEPAGLRGGVVYHDAQFDDARLAIALALTLDDLGGVAVNAVRVVGLLKAGGRRGLVTGVAARDEESGDTLEIAARVVINATGVFADAVRRLDEPEAPALLAPSQGVHLVLDRRFLPGDSAVLVPHTDDGRVLFAVPWLGRVIVGTTDTPVAAAALEPRPLPQEIEFLLAHAGRYLTGHPRAQDVLSCFAGLRPLIAGGGLGEGDGSAGATAALRRDHRLEVSASGLVTITGGKWTTYRRMGEDAVDAAAAVAGLPDRPSVTATLRLHGAPDAGGAADAADAAGGGGEGGDRREGGGGDRSAAGDWGEGGPGDPDLARLIAERPEWGEPLHPRLPYCAAAVVRAARHEMARGVEDALARRTRALLLDARASAEAAPRAAALLAAELGRDGDWQRRQVAAYRELARGYWLE